MMQWNFQNNYGVIALRDVCSCAPVFNFFVDPRNFPLGANLYQKLPFFMIVGAVSPHYLCHHGEIWYEGADLGLPPPCQIW